MSSASRQLPLPPGLFNLADHESHARQVLPEPVRAYFSGGAGDEITLRANRQAWERLQLLPRVLRTPERIELRTRLLGRDWPTPLLVAPMAGQRLAHPDGELATALAASALGAGMVLSTQTSTLPEAVARVALGDAGRGPLWFQLYGLGERGWLHELAQRAEAAGYEALVLTVDAPLSGVRDRERRSGFSLPADMLALTPPPAQAGGIEGLLQHALRWSDVEWLLGNTRLPLLLKGVVHPEDARQAARLGVAGLIVSNHGGRVLDTVPASAELLPPIAQAVQGDCALLLDGGIRRGTDVLKALALGAQGVLVGRPAIWGLANGGAAGVAHVLRLLLDEFMAAMALCGAGALADIGPDLLAVPPRS
ncbi:MAG: hypothetical protein RJA36_243 [Pseudomonadota bacterium]